MSAEPSASPPKRSFLESMALFVERRTLTMLVLGFSAGLPYLLIFDTLSAWLRDAGLSLEVIGFFSLATLAYAFKFLWAPVIDRATIPLLTPWLGHRRSWMLLAQILIVVGLLCISFGDPTKNLPLMAGFAVFVGFSSATQDIVLDAWRIEVSEITQQGAMAAAYQWGYRIAMIVAGAAPLLLADSYGWNFSYAVMAALMGIGMLGVLAAPREAQHSLRPILVDDVVKAPWREAAEWALRLIVLLIGALFLGSGLSGNATALAGVLSGIGLPSVAEAVKTAWGGNVGIWYQLLGVIAGFVLLAAAAVAWPGPRTRPGVYLGSALGDPLKDFFGRYGKEAGLILALICLYRISDFVLNIMNPFYLDLGFTRVEIAEVRKVFGVVMSMTGVFAGGFAVARFGLIRALLIGACAGPLSNLVFAWLTVRGHDVPALFVAIGVDNAASGFAGTCLIAYMSSLTAQGFTATQYAFFSSLYALPGKLVASLSGRIVEAGARIADSGGLFAPLKTLFSGLTPESFAQAMEKSGVSPQALACGYLVFFFYSTAIGVFAFVLTIWLAARNNKAAQT
jgi:PAT family beta-lactamase induction signal transducer AmpG